ncbi:hypothetical protein PYCCODRAFT_1421719 [Trametes coccinea BRFM310]|uniref:F-box domain-containing protein n=1 Tax=Trametes coccinea (strain BRFM310) TaxID=1353009 RepID=A0A1Y2J4U6_TRAC3|nr:hypothetical protein PYCCODRAFT_1421719 [Trametes coccinea BRFM310]
MCPFFDATFLRPLLSMSALHTIKIGHCSIQEQGMPWSTIQAILSTPQLQHLVLYSYRLAPTLFPGEELRLNAPPARLVSFRYILSEAESTPLLRSRYDKEEEALALILETCHTTLEVIELPYEPAPLDKLCSLQWPRLRELGLRGGHLLEKPPLSLILSTHMPKLRVLDLKITYPDDHAPEPLFHLESLVTFPYPYLQHLTLTFPCVEDELYRCLPPTLRTLSLVCYRHKSLQTTLYATYNAGDFRGTSWMSAGDVLRILQKCTLPHLEALEIEYCEDDQEFHLLHHTATAFTKLSTLKLLRYRRQGPEVMSASMEQLVQAIARISSLRVVHLHLDLLKCPTVTWSERLVCDYAPSDFDTYISGTLDPAAALLARALPPYDDIQWVEYGVLRCGQETRTHRIGSVFSNAMSDVLVINASTCVSALSRTGLQISLQNSGRMVLNVWVGVLPHIQRVPLYEY